MRARRLKVMAMLAVGLGSPAALANGRYPNADMLIVDPSEPTHLVLRATFGTLVSRDEGKSWSWICEQAVGYTGDPALTVLAGGSLLHAFLGNVTVSAEEGCSYTPVPFSPEGRFAIDVTLNPGDPTHAWVLASGLNGRRQASLLDASATSATPLLVADDFVPSTVEVSRSRPERMYVVGFDGSFQSTVLVSDDRGQSWSPHPIGLFSALPMYLSAIDPVDPDKLYVRVDDGTADHLIVSRDAGQTFVEVLTIASDMLGFALSPDGTQVAAGGPNVGLQVASTGDFAFSPAANILSLRCLTWTERGLFACAQESIDHYTLALSSDAGQSFTPLWHVQDLVPLECPASTSTGAECPRAWLDVSAQIGAELVPGSKDPEPDTAPPRADSSCETAPPARRGQFAFESATAALIVGAAVSLAARLRAARWRRPG